MLRVRNSAMHIRSRESASSAAYQQCWSKYQINHFFSNRKGHTARRVKDFVLYNLIQTVNKVDDQLLHPFKFQNQKRLQQLFLISCLFVCLRLLLPPSSSSFSSFSSSSSSSSSSLASIGVNQHQLSSIMRRC